MAKRKSLSKKLRFEVFKRDVFTCQYCGATPPASVLEIDHITPVSKKGSSEIDNLITSCFECNRGKRDGLLTDIPETIHEKKRIIQEKEDQLKEYNKVLSAKRRRQDRSIRAVENVFSEIYEDQCFTLSFKEIIRSRFLPYLPETEIIESMGIAIERTSTPDNTIKYFCGVCWNKRRSKEG